MILPRDNRYHFTITRTAEIINVVDTFSPLIVSVPVHIPHEFYVGDPVSDN